MPKPHSPCPPEFRQQMVELVRAGSSPEPLAKAFGPSGQTIRNWVIRADLDEGMPRDGAHPTGARGDAAPSPVRTSNCESVANFLTRNLMESKRRKRYGRSPKWDCLFPRVTLLETEGLTDCDSPIATWKPLMSVEKNIFI